MTGPGPFRIDVRQVEPDRVGTPVAEYPWQEMPDDRDRHHGTSENCLKVIAPSRPGAVAAFCQG